MKKSVSVALVVLLVAALAGLSAAAYGGKMSLKAGDEVYACACGEGCPCQTMSNLPGTCTCGKDLVKAKVISVEGDKALLKAENWEKERPFQLAAKYVCDCESGCPCNTQSQNPGKCSCGKEMKKVGP